MRSKLACLARGAVCALLLVSTLACGDRAPAADPASQSETGVPSAAVDAAPADATPNTPRRAPAVKLAHIVVLTQSAGYEHAVVNRAAPDEPSLVERVLRERWSTRGEVTLLRDARALDAELLARTDVLVLYTTGELPVPGGAAALAAWVRDGGALLGVHSVSDTFHEQPEFAALLGGEFDGHPWHQAVRLLVVDRAHTATASLGASLELTDEIYEYKQLASSDLHVLLRLDPQSVDMSRAKHPDSGHPLVWVREPGVGRVFHTGLGHRDELWSDDAFLAHLDGGLNWLLGGG